MDPQPLPVVLVVDRQSRLGYLELGSLIRPVVGVGDLGGFVGIPVAVGLVAVLAVGLVVAPVDSVGLFGFVGAGLVIGTSG